jgi:hypothetical protein
VIPNCSDIDFQLYLHDAAFSVEGRLPLEIGFAVRRDLEGIRLWPFRYVQCYARRPQPEPDLVGPIPGAYHLVAGKVPVPDASAHDLRLSARKGLDGLDPAPDFIMGKLLGHGGVRLERSLRLLCTKVWPVLYQVLTIQNRDSDPISLWCLPKEKAIECLPHGTRLHHTIHAFQRAVWAYYPSEDSLEDALSVIQTGLAFLQSAADWWQNCAFEYARSSLEDSGRSEPTP